LRGQERVGTKKQLSAIRMRVTDCGLRLSIALDST
jgi:hypothetical protein